MKMTLCDPAAFVFVASPPSICDMSLLSKPMRAAHVANAGNHKAGSDFRQEYDAPSPAKPRPRENKPIIGHRRCRGMAACHFRSLRDAGVECAANRCPTHSDRALPAREQSTSQQAEKFP